MLVICLIALKFIFLPCSALLRMSQAFLLFGFWVCSANIGRSRTGEAWVSSLLQKSILNQWVALPFTWTHLSMLPALSFVLFSSQACLSFTLHQFQIPSFCNSQGDFYFLTGPWQTQGWLVVLNYNKTFYLLSSLQPPPFKEHKTGLCFFHIFYICGGIFWLFKYLC